MRGVLARGLIGAAVLAAGLAAGGLHAQDRAATLADIRQQLTIVNAEIQALKRELNTTGFAGNRAQVSGDIIDRVQAMEEELKRLTARVEELTFRVDRVVADGTRRIADLEFRLVELEGGDVSQLKYGSTLGGGELPDGPAVVPGAGTGDEAGGPDLAVAEADDFNAAKSAFDAGDYEVAAEGFAQFVETYPAGALTAQAHFWRGEALARLGRWTKAARAYLNAFSGEPEGPVAAQALLKLGIALDRIGQRDEACLTLGEVPVRFPGTPEAADAEAEMARLTCS